MPMRWLYLIAVVNTFVTHLQDVERRFGKYGNVTEVCSKSFKWCSGCPVSVPLTSQLVGTWLGL